MSAHTPGALRAARMCAVHSIDMDSSARHFAEIIDRETGARELLEALREIVERDLTYFGGYVDGSQIMKKTVENARAAIAKAEGRA